jgi:hypothetical protein
MTTIVYRDGVMCGDGRETSSSEGESSMIIRDDCVKVFKMKDGSLFGGAKTSEDIERLHRALIAGKKPPKLEDVNAMRVDPRGRIWSYEGRIWQAVTSPFYAVGTGAIFAFPLLKAGLPARRIVEIVLTCDPYSGGLISEVILGKRNRNAH